MLTGTEEDGVELTVDEARRHPHPLLGPAWVDGYQASGAGDGERTPFPRRLTRLEADAWRDGHELGLVETGRVTWE